MIAQAPALWAFEEDIVNRTWLDWLSAHYSFGKPLHRYEGQITINAGSIELNGFDKKTKEPFELIIYKPELEQVYHGFDEVFKLSEARGMGLTFLPLRLAFTKDDKTHRLYLIINYRFCKTDNAEYFEFLKQWA